MTVRFDHAVCFVQDLDVARERFRKAGFDVRMGGVHAGGLTRNALIGFADGSYLELLAINLPDAGKLAFGLRAAGAMGWVLRGRTALDRRFLPRAERGEGLIDWAVARNDVDRALAQGSGWLDGPFPGERRRPDGVRLAWDLAMPADHVSPFLIRDVTNRSLRVPAASNHPNGAAGIESVTIECADLERARGRFSVLLETTPKAESSNGETVFDLDGVTVSLRRSECAIEGPVSIRLRDWSPSASESLVRGIGAG